MRNGHFGVAEHRGFVKFWHSEVELMFHEVSIFLQQMTPHLLNKNVQSRSNSHNSTLVDSKRHRNAYINTSHQTGTGACLNATQFGIWSLLRSCVLSSGACFLHETRGAM